MTPEVVGMNRPYLILDSLSQPVVMDVNVS